MIISRNLKLSDIPETMWLPPEIRSLISNGSQHRSAENVYDQLIRSLTALSDRIMHAESLLAKLDMDTRLNRLESSTTHPFELPIESELPVIPPSYVPQRRAGA